MAEDVLLFGACELRVAARELVVAGELRPLEPRPFALLLYLLENRHRVVAREELVEHLWPHEHVSPSAVARADMKLRKAIGADDAEAPLVRTVHRTGYRFAGEVQLRPGRAQRAGGVQSLALLPLDNGTGQADFDWVELGLLSLVVRDLGSHPQLALPTIPALLSALQNVHGERTLEQRASAVQRLLGVQHVVHATVHWGRGGGFGLRVRWLPTPAQAHAPAEADAELQAGDLPALGRLLAAWIERQLFPGQASRLAATQQARPAAEDAFARALQAVAQQRWTLALELLEAVLQADASHTGARRERLRALVALDRDEAFELGDALLQALAAQPDPVLEAAVHLELAQAYVRRRLTAKARLHADRLMQLPPQALPGEMALAVTLLRASIAMIDVDFVQGRRLLDQAERLCDEHDNVFDRIRITSMRVVLEGETGSMAQACEHARRAAALYRDHGVLVGQARAECNYANASASLGRFKVSVQHGESALAISRNLDVPTDTAASAVLLCGLYRCLRKPRSLERVLGALDGLDTGAAPRTELFRLVCRAQLALARRDGRAAARLLARARDEAQAGGEPLQLHFVMPLLVAAQVAAGELLAAEQGCQAIEALPGLARDAHLRAALLHGRAQIAHAQGDAGAALRRLQQAADAAPPGWWNAHARMDAAWLLLEAGQAEEAAARVDGLDGWLAEYPAGRAVWARLCQLRGHHEEARSTHALLVASFEAEPSPAYAALGQAYEAQRRGAPPAAWPVAPALASAM